MSFAIKNQKAISIIDPRLLFSLTHHFFFSFFYLINTLKNNILSPIHILKKKKQKTILKDTYVI